MNLSTEVVFIILLVIGIIVFFFIIIMKSINSRNCEIYENKLKDKYNEVINEINNKQNELKNYNELINSKTIELNQLDREEENLTAAITKSKAFNESQLASLDLLKAERISKIEKELDEVKSNREKQINEEIEGVNSELLTIKSELDKFKSIQDSLNEEMRRRREQQEQQDFYRIRLSDEAKSDINYLISLLPNLKNKEILSKLIWSEYLQKPFQSMLKRVLGNKDPRNIIYIVTNIETKEIYIGQTRGEISKRWTEHIKSSLSIGALVSSNFHKALYNNWDKFTFAILEEVGDNSKLNEREKYYIGFYQSDKYGYNIKAGG